MKKHRFVSLFVLFLVVSATHFTVSAQIPKRPNSEEHDWRYVLLAQDAYNRNDYGQAMSYLQTAKAIRRQNVAWEIYTLNIALTPNEVQRAGDRISDVIPVLRERDTNEAADILELVIEKKTYEFFKGSISEIMSYIKQSEVYPEADYLLGKVYQIEGEYPLAMKYYNDAWLNRSFLDIPDQRFDILYEMADLALSMNNPVDYEKFLLTIVSEDEVYKNETLKKAMLRTISVPGKIGNESNVDRFFNMYRANNIRCLKAYYLLAHYYAENGLYEKALHASALGNLTSYSRIIEAMLRKNDAYTFETLQVFFTDIQANSEILEWSENQGFWTGLLDFASIAQKSGSLKFAKELLTVLIKTAPHSLYRNRAGILMDECLALGQTKNVQ